MESLKSGVVPSLRVFLAVIGIPIAGRPRTKRLYSLPILTDEVCVDGMIHDRERVPNVFGDLNYILAK